MGTRRRISLALGGGCLAGQTGKRASRADRRQRTEGASCCRCQAGTLACRKVIRSFCVATILFGAIGERLGSIEDWPALYPFCRALSSPLRRIHFALTGRLPYPTARGLKESTHVSRLRPSLTSPNSPPVTGAAMSCLKLN